MGELARSADNPVPPIVTQDSIEKFQWARKMYYIGMGEEKKRENSNDRTYICTYIHDGSK